MINTQDTLLKQRLDLWKRIELNAQAIFTDCMDWAASDGITDFDELVEDHLSDIYEGIAQGWTDFTTHAAIIDALGAYDITEEHPWLLEVSCDLRETMRAAAAQAYTREVQEKVEELLKES